MRNLKLVSLLVLSLSMFLVGCGDSRTPEEQQAAYEQSLRFDDAYALANGQTVLLFNADSTFNLGLALDRYINIEHKGKRKVVSIAVRPGRGEYNLVRGYWVVVEDVK